MILDASALLVFLHAAAHRWEITRSYGLSLADRACLALSVEQQATVLTADRTRADLDLNIEVQLPR